MNCLGWKERVLAYARANDAWGNPPDPTCVVLDEYHQAVLARPQTVGPCTIGHQTVPTVF